MKLFEVSGCCEYKETNRDYPGVYSAPTFTKILVVAEDFSDILPTLQDHFSNNITNCAYPFKQDGFDLYLHKVDIQSVTVLPNVCVIAKGLTS